jgi:hypothetical protein
MIIFGNLMMMMMMLRWKLKQIPFKKDTTIPIASTE